MEWFFVFCFFLTLIGAAVQVSNNEKERRKEEEAERKRKKEREERDKREREIERAHWNRKFQEKRKRAMERNKELSKRSIPEIEKFYAKYLWDETVHRDPVVRNEMFDIFLRSVGDCDSVEEIERTAAYSQTFRLDAVFAEWAKVKTALLLKSYTSGYTSGYTFTTSTIEESNFENNVEFYFKQSTLKKCKLGGDFSFCVFEDVNFIGCDLSDVEDLMHVAFIGCTCDEETKFPEKHGRRVMGRFGGIELMKKEEQAKTGNEKMAQKMKERVVTSEW